MLSVRGTLAAIALSVLYLSLGVTAAPAADYEAPLGKRVVINPPVTAPNATTTWKTGEQNVQATWTVPEGAEGYSGTLRLGYLEADDPSGNEHLFEKPLAEGFQLTDGSVTFDVPCDKKIKSRTSYIVVLMGDSGNKSAQFAIERDASLCPKGGKKGSDKKGKGDKGGEPSTKSSTAHQPEQTGVADVAAV